MFCDLKGWDLQVFSDGGGYRGRTDDLLNAIQALYQTELIPHQKNFRC